MAGSAKLIATGKGESDKGKEIFTLDLPLNGKVVITYENCNLLAVAVINERKISSVYKPLASLRVYKKHTVLSSDTIY